MDGIDLFDPDPEAFFTSVAGPLATDVIGPPLDVLDTFTDGTPVAESQARVANGVGGGVHTRFFHRGDVQALGLAVAGALLIHWYLGGE